MLPPISLNLAAVHERIAAAAARAGRDPKAITLVAVTKTHPWSFVQAALAAGQVDFGENRPEEALPKFEQQHRPVEPGQAKPQLHLIGPIQSRKAKIAFDCEPILIHSIDRLKIAVKLNDLAQTAGQKVDILFQVNVSGEASKSGFSPAELRSMAPELLALPALVSHGLTTIPPFDLSPDEARPHFIALRDLADSLASDFPQADWSQLSMGMSHDFEVAIEEGATLVRVGSAIFGPR